MHRALPVPDEAVWRHVTAFQQDICENVVIEACTDQGSLLFPKVEFFFIKAHTRGLSFFISMQNVIYEVSVIQSLEFKQKTQYHGSVFLKISCGLAD